MNMLKTMKNINLTIDKAFFGVMSESIVVEAIEMNYQEALEKCNYYNSTNYKGQKYTVVQLGLDGNIVLERDKEK